MICAITDRHHFPPEEALGEQRQGRHDDLMKTSTATQALIRRSDERGHTDLGWLESRHSFSFGEYYDPACVAFRSLRVINDDHVAPGMGFGTHPHRDMEILTYVVSGQLQHRDSMGNGRIIQAGELQAMSAGKGVSHSEFNPSRTEPVHFLQIWIQPSEKGLAPSYAELKPTPATVPLKVLASPDARQGSLPIHQDAVLYLGTLAAGESVTHRPAPGRGLWVQVLTGNVHLGEDTLHPGDSAQLEDAAEVTLTGVEASTFLVFDLA